MSKQLASKIKDWRFEVSDTHGFKHAEVSGGGVNTDEVNDKTMESKGYDSSNWMTKKFEGAGHDEDSWRKRLGIPLEFLLAK